MPTKVLYCSFLSTDTLRQHKYFKNNSPAKGSTVKTKQPLPLLRVLWKFVLKCSIRAPATGTVLP